MLLKIHAYAGWNTSSNTIGTALSEACVYSITRDDKKNVNFLLHRYYEDVGYMGYARRYVTDKILPSFNLNYYVTDGKKGKASMAVEKEITAFMNDVFPSISCMVEKVDVSMPWVRMFEADVKLTLK